MPSGQIDSASIAAVIALLLEPKKKHCEWTLKSALETTMLLINEAQLGVAPAPTHPEKGVKDYHKIIVDELKEMLILLPSNPEIHTAASADVERWVNENDAKSIFYETIDDNSYNIWIDTAIKEFWVGHCQRLHGLFDKTYIPLIYKIFEGRYSMNTIKDAWKWSNNKNVVELWSKKRPEKDNLFVLTRDAFSLTAILRGRHHDYVAKSCNENILHHPIRRRALSPLDPTHGRAATWQETYFALIIIASAMREYRRTDRMLHWAENVKIARNAIHQNKSINFPEEPLNQEKALNFALKASKEAGLKYYSKHLSAGIDLLISLLFLKTPPFFVIAKWIDSGLKRVTTHSAGEYIVRLETPPVRKVKQLAGNIKGRITGSFNML